MKKYDIEKLVQLRAHVIRFYNSLEGRDNPSPTMMDQLTVARECETIISSIDDILKPHVTFT
jgi:hypothetical protein